MRTVEIIEQVESRITSLEATKDYLEIDDATQDDILGVLIDAASDYVKHATGLEFVETTYKEAIDGKGRKALTLSQHPVISIASLEVNDRVIEEYHQYDSGVIKRKSNIFPEGDLNVEIEYTAGYKEIPQDLQKAVWSMINTQLEGKDYEGLESYSIGDESMTWRTDNLPPETVQTIQSYKSVM